MISGKIRLADIKTPVKDLSIYRHSGLLASGMLAVFFYTAHVVLGGLLWKGYSHLQQPISDLTATGAPDRSLLLIFTTVYSLLALLFAVSFFVLESKKHHKFVVWGSLFFILTHVISLAYAFFPQDLPNQPVTFSGVMHIVVTALIVPFTILSPIFIGIGFIKEQAWRRIGHFSVLAGCLLVIFGGTTAYLYAMKLSWFGIAERLNIGTLQLWTFYLSFKLATGKRI